MNKTYLKKKIVNMNHIQKIHAKRDPGTNSQKLIDYVEKLGNSIRKIIFNFDIISVRCICEAKIFGVVVNLLQRDR